MAERDDAAERRARRASWPVRRAQLTDAPGDDLSATTTPEQRIGMMWELAVEAWLVSGRELPAYSRAECPVRAIRPGEPRDDGDD